MAKNISNFTNEQIYELKKTPFLCESCYNKLGRPVWYDLDREGYSVRDPLHAVFATVATAASGVGGAAATFGGIAGAIICGGMICTGPFLLGAMAVGGVVTSILGGKKAFEKLKCECSSLCTSAEPSNLAIYKFNKDKVV